MTSQPSRCCAVCGLAAENCGAAYLLSSSQEGEKLQVLNWDNELAKTRGIRMACQPAHVIEIAAYWMATGSLWLTFARGGSAEESGPCRSAAWASPPQRTEHQISALRFVGELSVDRSSLPEAFITHPDLLATLLGTLLVTLDHAERKIPPRPPLAAQMSNSASAA